MITYDSANVILNAARQRAGDKLASLLAYRGNFLDRTQAATQQAFNSAWRKLQEILAAAGYPALTDEVIFAAFYAVVGTDPAIQQWIDITGAFDGKNDQVSPVLPAGPTPPALIQPMKLWERITAPAGSVPGAFQEMTQVFDGLPAVPKTFRNIDWEWRDDTLYLPGATSAVDLRLRYAAFLPDIVDVTTSPWFTQPVPIARCLEPMADFILAEFAAAAQDSESAAAWEAAGRAATMLIANRNVNQAMLTSRGAELNRMALPPTPASEAA